MEGMFRPGLQRLFSALTPAPKVAATGRDTVKSGS